MSNRAIQLPDDVLSFLGPVNGPLFGWLWDRLKQRNPDIGCRRTKRYIGLYTATWSRSIFAYVDSQTSGLSIGVAKMVVDRIQPIPFNPGPFPNWSNREHVEFFLIERIPEIVDVLDAAYKEKALGIASIDAIGVVNTKAHELLQVAKDDIASLEYEETMLEGEKKSRYSSYYERIPKWRARAIAIHGTSCMVSSCGFNFAAVYGDRGSDFIEVHHRKPLSWNGGEPRPINPKTDMAVVCSNCHRMIHRYPNRVLTLEQVSSLIERQRPEPLRGRK